MNRHKNARLFFQGRRLLVEHISVLGVIPAAMAAGITPRTARKWRERYTLLGEAGLYDKSSRPMKVNTSLTEQSIVLIESLRKERLLMRTIASQVGISLATVSRVCKTLGLSSLKALEPKAMPVRYEHEAPGDLLRMDTKKLVKFKKPGHKVTDAPKHGYHANLGYEVAHIAIDDHSRAGFAKILPDEQKETAVSFLKVAIKAYSEKDITIKRLITDNGSAYRSKAFKDACLELNIKHSYTRAYRPQTNGKAERFIQTCLREWAYAKTWESSSVKNHYLDDFIHFYNEKRPRSALNNKPPISRINGNNLLQNDT